MLPMVVALVALFGLVVIVFVVFFQLVKQHGRLLLRLDELEARLADPGPTGSSSNGHSPRRHALPPGSAVAPFRFPDLSGRSVGLEDFRGRQVLLVNWSPPAASASR